LGRKEIQSASRYFARVEVLGFFNLATLAAVPFRNSTAFPHILRGLEAVDGVLLRLPLLKWWAWAAVFVLSGPKKSLGTPQ
jgi:hypothetical protein